MNIGKFITCMAMGFYGSSFAIWGGTRTDLNSGTKGSMLFICAHRPYAVQMAVTNHTAATRTVAEIGTSE